MDYEKAYKASLKTAAQWIKDGCTDKEKICLECVFPELRESEDERIRMKLFHTVRGTPKDNEWFEEISKEAMLAWLEKQKENPKSVDSIPSDCASNARCPYKIYGDEDFIGDIKDTPAYHFGFDEGVRSEREKQKEQKPEHFELKAGKWYICHRAFCCRADHLTVKEGERFQCEKDGIVKGFVIKEPEKYFKECSAPAPMEDEQKEQKPAEWSEEDADILNCCISSIEEAKENRYAYKETDGDTSYDREIDWLKSLRPSWKPTYEQMEALRKAVNKLADTEVADSVRLSIMYDHLKELI